MTPEIIYEDTDIIVCYKPAGVATETNRIGQQDMVSLLKNYRASKGESPYIGLVHRLDQPVEGLLVFGKNRQVASELSRQVQQHSIGKYYYAVGLGADTKEDALAVGHTATLTDYILFDRKKNISSIVPESTPQAKKAVLDYCILGWDMQRVCFDITLHTGRHHQIRLQMAHCGFPLLGDQKYGGGDLAASQLALCSYRLSFRHPATAEQMDFSIRPQNTVFTDFV